ncbi:MAG TPA: hypothetical protein VJS63_01900 [Bradyrhizobium sp.]|nr:hypothetical protein [Bradyrhizobium sp.]
MQELLLGSLGVQILAFTQRHPWQVFAGVLVATLIVIELLRKNRSSAGGDLDFGGADFGGGDGDGGD